MRRLGLVAETGDPFLHFVVVLAVRLVALLAKVILDLLQAEAFVDGVELIVFIDFSAVVIHVVFDVLFQLVHLVEVDFVVVDLAQQLLEFGHVPAVCLLDVLKVCDCRALLFRFFVPRFLFRVGTKLQLNVSIHFVHLNLEFVDALLDPLAMCPPLLFVGIHAFTLRKSLFGVRLRLQIALELLEALHLHLYLLSRLGEANLVLDCLVAVPSFDLLSISLQLLDLRLEFRLELFALVFVGRSVDIVPDVVELLDAFVDLFEHLLDFRL
mmetsp:Transcript_22175/g.76062  ORF Transcript_22175/g.76062 Transcript_22175/m.76062 type:complete len:268 (-) Transcript_22175:123-926(-)